MLRLYPEQLQAQLNKKLSSVYLLLGNDPFLLQESQSKVCRIAADRGFNERHIIQIDNSTDWQEIFSLCQAMSLFASRKILILVLPENSLNIAINTQLVTLGNLLHSDLLLVVRGNKLTKIQKNATWFTMLSTKAVLVTCQTPNSTQLPKWVVARSRQHNLQIDKSACQLLCHCYEGNLLALAQVLEQLSLMWPDGKLTLLRIEQVVNDAARFTPIHWIEALLTAKIKHALYILRQLRLTGVEPVILLRILQRELLLLINLKRQSVTTSLSMLFDKHCIWQNRRVILIKAINRLSHDQLRQAVHLFIQIELTIKQDYSQSVWSELESLSLVLCHKALEDVFIDG